MPTRREFFRLLAATAALAAVDPADRLLWVPRQRVIVDLGARPSLGEIIAEVWADVIAHQPTDNIFNSRALLYLLEDA